MPTNRYHVWMANLGPSEALLRAARDGEVTWTQFTRRYREDLFATGAMDSLNRTIKDHGQKFTLRLIKQLARKGNVTLLCHCAEDQDQCHRHVLRELIQSGKV